MKRVCFTLLLCLFLTLSSSCVSTNNTVNDLPVNNTDNIGGIVQEDGTTGLPSTVSVEEQVVLDHNGIVITVKSLEMDQIWGPCLKVLVENNSNQSVTVQLRDVAVNGVMVETIFSCDVAAGKKANDEITFLPSDLEAAGIETIKDIEFKFHIFDAESWDTIFDSDTVYITTTADPSFVQTYDDSGFVALDQNGFKIVIKELDSTGSLWGADVHVYIENNSATDAIIQIRNMSVNGFMIDPIFSVEVLAGKKAFDTITFMEHDLSANDITSIEKLEFNFHIFDTGSWKTIFDSAPITVTF